MATYYVATNGSNSGSGSSSSPWKTISHAVNANLRPGDVVIVRPGTYSESVSINRDGSAGNPITLKSEVPGEALIRGTKWNAISVNADYITIDGFNISGRGGGDGIEANGVHHIEILNNVVHGNRESGIQFNHSDFIRVEGNVTYGNAASGWFSGISIYQNRNITRDNDTDGFRTIIRDNISYGNITRSGAHTDGNGIIIDDFQSTQTRGFPNYTFPTLVENNLVYGNGGKGIQLAWSDYVTVRNNTSYHNNVDNQNTGTWRGELSNAISSNNTWVNNIAVANPKINSNNTAIDNTSFGGYKNQNVVWENNLTFNGVAGNASFRTDGGNAAPSAARGNLLGLDPRFVDPGSGDFLLRPGSPALNTGSDSFGLSLRDLLGNDRTVGRVDLGAYEMPGDGAVNNAPVARYDTGFAALSGRTIIIDDGRLLRNDTDSDGDALTIVGVANARGGSVALTADGDVAFTANAGFTGTARFTYTVGDGKGGFGSARVLVDVTAPPAGNQPPVARNDSGFSTEAGTTVRIAPSALLSNDSDANGDPLTITNVTNGTGGTVRLAANGDVLFTPAAGYGGNANFGYRVSDGRGGSDTATVTVAVASKPPGTAGEGLWDDRQLPAVVADPDRVGVQLGVKFKAEVDGTITGISFYRGSGATDADTVKLWTSSGQLIATATTSNNSKTGWIDVAFGSPVAVDAGQTYVASYYAPSGQYAVSQNYFTKPYATSELSVGTNGGVYSYGSASNFPTSTYAASNYWVDLMFKADGARSKTLAQATFGEYGTTMVDDAWKTVSFAGDYDDPAIIAFDMSASDSDPIELRIRNVDTSANTFQIAVDEPNYLDGKHGSEKISWLVVESGTWRLADGTIFSAGTVDTNRTLERGMVDVDFDRAFQTTPHVYSSVNSYRGPDWVTTRHDDVTTDGFRLAMQEEEALGPHLTETIGYVAVSNGPGTDYVKSISGLTHNGVRFGFDDTFFADMQTTNDRDTAVVRADGADGRIFIQEESSADAETNHGAEIVSVLGFDGSFGRLEGVELLA